MSNVIRDLVVRFGFQGNTGGVQAFGAAVDRAAAAARNAGGSLDGLTAHAQRANSGMSGLGATIRNLVGAYLGFEAIKGAVGGLLAANNEFEKLNVQLVTIEGSQAGADKAFAGIEKFAAKTPYSLGQVTEAFIKLKQLGMDPSEEALTAYGNTASSMGKPLSQMIEAVADAATGEFERLKEFGIKAKKQGDKVEFTFKGVKKSVKNESKDIQAYLRNIGKTDFAGAMDRQSKTLSGIMSNLGDNMGRIARKIGKGGLLDALKEAAGGAVDLSGTFDDLATDIGRKLGTGIRWLTANMRTIATVSGIVAAGFTAIQLGQFAQMAWRGVTALRALGAAGLFANASVMLIPLAIGAAIIAVGLIAEDIYQFANGGKSVLGGLVKQFPALGTAVDSIGAFFKYAIPQVQVFWDALKTGVTEGIAAYGPALVTAFGLAYQVVSAWVVAVVSQFWAFSQGAAAIIMGLVDFVVGVWQNPSDIIALFGQLMQTIFTAATTFASTTVENLMTFLNDAFGVNVPAMLAAVAGYFVSTWASIYNTVSGWISSIIGVIMSVPSAIGSAFSGLGRLAAAAGSVLSLGPGAGVGPTAGRYGAGGGGNVYNGGPINVNTNSPVVATAAVNAARSPQLIAGGG